MKVFVSYSHKDTAIVNLISTRLKKAGHEVWIDSLKLKPGDNIAEKIQEGILTADAFLVVVSQNSLGSKWVMQEFSSLALSELSKLESKIIPVLVDDSTVPSYLSKYIYIDLARDLIEGLNKLVNSLEGERIKEPVISERSTEQSTDARSAQIAGISSALKSGRLTLVCGAGVSVGAGVPIWNQLLLQLLESMIERLSKTHSLELGSNAAAEFNRQHSATTLIVGKYLKNNLGNDFSKKVRDALYSANPTSCDLIDAIVQLARPQRDGKPLDSIITFNFDCLIEENMDMANVLNRAIYTEAINHDSNELPIYHVHGYLPRNDIVPEASEIVFSEDAYHSQFIEPFSWSNLIQLSKLTQNTCLFIGVSLTDPNLRRLLDVAWRKNPEQSIGHYIIKKLPSFGSEGAVLNDLARILEEQDANALGINVIWVDEYPEISTLLKSIR